MEKTRCESCPNPIKHGWLTKLLKKEVQFDQDCPGPELILTDATIIADFENASLKQELIRTPLCTKELTPHRRQSLAEFERMITDSIEQAAAEITPDWDNLTEEEKRRILDTPQGFSN